MEQGAPILALDVARVTGWALGPVGTMPKIGAVELCPPGSSIGKLLSCWRLWLDDMMTLNKLGGLAFEAPLDQRRTKNGSDTARRLLGMAGVVELVAYDHGLGRVEEVNVKTVKASFAGNGNAEKSEMVRVAQLRGAQLPVRFREDAADAFAVWTYVEGCWRPKAAAARDVPNFKLV
jgi:hypothetical protein